jgi:hypothetical protein
MEKLIHPCQNAFIKRRYITDGVMTDVGITIQVPIIGILGADYGGGLAQCLDKLDPHVISTWTTRKKTPIRILQGLL